MTQIPYKHRFQIGKHASQKLFQMNSRTRTISMALTSCFKVGPCQLYICLKKKSILKPGWGIMPRPPTTHGFLQFQSYFRRSLGSTQRNNFLSHPTFRILFFLTKLAFRRMDLNKQVLTSSFSRAMLTHPSVVSSKFVLKYRQPIVGYKENPHLRGTSKSDGGPIEQHGQGLSLSLGDLS